MALIAAEAASDKKAMDIVAIDVGELLVVTDYFVICTGGTDRQVRTIADEVEDAMRERAAMKPIGREGNEEGRWVLVDFADVVVHIFQPDEREFYRLEKLWGEAPHLKLPKEINAPSERPAQAQAVPAEESAQGAVE